MEFLYLIFYACLRLRFLNVKNNPGQRHPVPAVCGILCSNVQGLDGNLSDLVVASSQYDILLCCETLVSDMCHVSEVQVPVYCLLASMAAVQAQDVHASFLFVGDLNGHHQEWLSSTTTNRHGDI